MSGESSVDIQKLRQRYEAGEVGTDYLFGLLAWQGEALADHDRLAAMSADVLAQRERPPMPFFSAVSRTAVT